jgi:uncharacterized protein YbcI
MKFELTKDEIEKITGFPVVDFKIELMKDTKTETAYLISVIPVKTPEYITINLTLK